MRHVNDVILLLHSAVHGVNACCTLKKTKCQNYFCDSCVKFEVILFMILLLWSGLVILC